MNPNMSRHPATINILKSLLRGLHPLKASITLS
jgi:hypothetical protein